MWKKEGLSILNFKLRINNKGERWDRLKQLIRLAYHLMLMHHLLPGRRFQQIEAAILAAAALAAHRRNDILHRIDANRIARLLLYPTYEISLSNYLAALVAALIRDGITEHNHIATIEKIAVNPIHYHPVASFQLRRKTSRGHREDSECIGSHHPHQEQRQA